MARKPEAYCNTHISRCKSLLYCLFVFADLRIVVIFFCHIFVYSELNVATVDPDLFVLLAQNVTKTVQLYVSKCEQLVSCCILFQVTVITCN